MLKIDSVCASPGQPTTQPSPEIRRLETRRAELCARLRSLGNAAEVHPAYKAVPKLLSNIYRKEKLTNRLDVLQSAAWLIDILERLADRL